MLMSMPNQPVTLTFFLAILLMLTSLAGCGWLPGEYDETKDWSVDKIYSEAKEAMSDGNYERAIKLFEKLQARYPFGRYAQQAQLELIYANFKAGEPDAAVAAADRFIRTYPRHPYVDYAYYMKGLVNFTRESGALARLVPADPSKTDTSTARQSYNDFAELVQKFPNSQYAEDAQLRMLFLHNSLAAYEVNVAKYYLRREAYVAAVNRATYVLENYARTPAAADALAVMTQAYLRMGMKDLATASLRVLTLNYPTSPHIPELNAQLTGSGSGSRSLFSRFSL